MTPTITKRVLKKGKKNARSLIYWVCTACREERTSRGISGRAEAGEAESSLEPQQTTVADNVTTPVDIVCVDAGRNVTSKPETDWLVSLSPSSYPSSEGDKEEYSFVSGDEALHELWNA
ncbi:hypothetical protein FRB95_014079 [Tulasnella sp. JGI-2019a]|nr:hypothetical protein FRB95_014079 [Tulasnella sp. JGI-2019a]